MPLALPDGKLMLTTTQSVYDDAKKIIEAAGPLPAMVGMQASQKANRPETMTVLIIGVPWPH